MVILRSLTHRTAIALATALLLTAGRTAAQTSAPEPTTVLPPVVVEAPPPVAASSQVLIPAEDFELRPHGRPADIVRLVPGLVIGQHAGGGKAEQYFLRGFDADHGSDVALFVDGVPVNLRTHAHGQGYADLHFLIPETVKRVEAFKGPYHVEFGDFATAGAVNFVTLDVVPENLVQLSGGSFDTHRYLTLLSPTRDRVKTLLALEGYFTDGPFERAQNFQRFNGFGKATVGLTDALDLTLSASHYRSAWHASGQVPVRAVRSGLIDRFGAIDNSEGGATQRTVVDAILRWRPTERDVVTVQTYGQYYALDLFSNFTFFLNDPVNGDGIVQGDRRWVGGVDARWQHTRTPFGIPLITTAGLQYRIDTPRVILGTQADRHRLARTQDVDVVEQSYSPFLKLDAQPLAWLRLVGGARGDIFHFDVRDNLGGAGGRLEGNATRAVPSWKANAILGPWLGTEFFANYGTGFHSNDARSVTSNPSGVALPEARGWEVGVRTKPHRRLELTASYWQLDLDSELVFVGDEGTTEIRGPSRRRGFEVGGRVSLLEWLVLSGDVTVSRAHFTNGDEVPLAPRLTARGDLTARLPWGVATTLEVRHVGDRFASEDRHQTARGYTLVDFTARYRYRSFEVFVGLENLFDVDYREAQFFFTSRLRGEPAAGVDDIHFTPGQPRAISGGIAWRF
jgi:outer membrane receptor protein involved in Fe transport